MHDLKPLMSSSVSWPDRAGTAHKEKEFSKSRISLDFILKKAVFFCSARKYTENYTLGGFKRDLLDKKLVLLLDKGQKEGRQRRRYKNISCRVSLLKNILCT